MEKIKFGQNFNKPIVLCLGFFDCMHLGHQKLLERARKLAQGDQVALFTFQNNHFETLKRPTKLLFTFDEREGIYQSLGVDVLITARFDRQFMLQTGAEFLEKLKMYNLKAVVCGTDYTCGSNLISSKQIANLLPCPVEIVPLVMFGSEKVGSSFVRDYVARNDVEQANKFLSQPFFFCGTVQQGRHVGHNLGFPTVNLTIPSEKIYPQGVFAGSVSWQDNTYPAVVNVGTKPTFDCSEATVEAHIIGFDGDLYGTKIKVALTKFLRPICKFDTPDQLREQLQKDIKAVQQ